MSAPRLKLNGKALNLHPPRPTETRIKQFLDKSAPDELYTSEELGKHTGLAGCTVRCEAIRLAESLPEYTANPNRNRYWGNPKAIAELLRQVNA